MKSPAQLREWRKQRDARRARNWTAADIALVEAYNRATLAVWDANVLAQKDKVRNWWQAAYSAPHLVYLKLGYKWRTEK